MNKPVVTIALLVLLGPVMARADDVLTSHPDTSTWGDLFAADLTNGICPPGVWAWKDGELSPKDKDEALWTKQDYENFVLDLEFKLEPGSNSGVFVYNTDLKNWVVNTIEIQLLDDSSPKWANIPPNWKCGGIFGHSVPLKAAVKMPGQWNRMTIRCRGPRIEVLLNGALVTNVDMKEWKSGKTAPDGSAIVDFEPHPLAEMATKGRIGLQGAHGGIPTHFRNVRIKLLDEKPKGR
jgi:hypothetical protein